MNYTTEELIKKIESKEYRRKEAVFLAGRIKRANQSPGFDWDKAIKGYRLKFQKERRAIVWRVKEEYPDSPDEKIDWVQVILYFSEQPYNKGE
jgi:hypothetical protein